MSSQCMNRMNAGGLNHVNKIKYLGGWAFAGLLLLLVIILPTTIPAAEYQGDLNPETIIQPRTASYPDYLYTIKGGITGLDGTPLFWPEGIAINSTGHVYVADGNNERVQVYDSAGVYQYTIGITGESGSDNAHFYLPTDVAVNATGHVYVADPLNDRVQVFDNAGHYEYTIGSTAIAVAVNGTGCLYAAQYFVTHRVMVFDNAGKYQYSIGETDPGSDNAHFNSTTGVAVNSIGYVYVSDANNHRVQVFDNAGIYQYTIGVTGESGSDNAHFASPRGSCVNATGYLYVADGGNDRVQVFNPIGIYQYTIGVTGVSGSDNNHFSNPCSVAVNATGHAYVVDHSNSRVQVFSVGLPVGLTVSINSGAADTTTPSVVLTLSAHEAAEMCLSNNGTTYTAWEPFISTKDWTLDGGVGPKTVYFKARNALGESGPSIANINYTLLPTGLTITINGGAAETGSTSVTLALTATGATEMCFSNDGSFYYAWEAYSTSKVWTLYINAGLKTVYFKARNGTIEAAAPVMDSITYVPPPSDPFIHINDILAETNTLAVTLTLGATGATEMCFSNDNVTWSAWEPFATTKAWSLEGAAGVKTVYFKARNSQHELAPVYDTITYQPSPEPGPIGIPGFPIIVLLAVTCIGVLYIAGRKRRFLRA